MKCTLIVLVVLCSALAVSAEDTSKESTVEPKLVSIFPLGGQQGTTFEIDVTGKQLQGAYAVWFEDDELVASIQQVEEVENKKNDKKSPDDYKQEVDQQDYRARMTVHLPQQASLGLHLFRLVTPRGVSNALALQVVSEPVIAETGESHQRAVEAQPLSVPIVVNGQLTGKGEQDFYSLEVSQGEELIFAVRSDLGVEDSYRAEAEIALYEMTGSWFDPERITRLLVDGPSLSWEPIHRYQRISSTGKFTLFRRLAHRFRSAGRYLLSVRTFVGSGGPNHGYQLRIVPRKSEQPSGVLGVVAHHDPSDWLERDSASLRQLGSFGRSIEPNYLELLFSRGGLTPEMFVGTKPGGLSRSNADGLANPGPPRSTRLVPFAEVEPNDSVHQSGTIAVPGLVEGRVQKAGDEDYFHFTAEAGQRIAFEIETPHLSPPQFNPWLKVFDSQGKQLVENIYKEYGGDGDDVNKTIERKTIYTFAHAGDYYVQIRGLTSLQSGPEFKYRLLVRPQIPHLGRFEVSLGVTQVFSSIVDKTDRINLEVGQTREMVVVCEKEEGFDGDIAFTVENLPPGVRALPSTSARWTETLMRGVQYRPLDTEVMPSIHHRAERTSTTLLLSAVPDASTTTTPRFVHVMAWPVVEGKAGRSLPAGRIPFMLLPPNEAAPVSTASR